MEISLKGKVALVTGASKGIGRAIAATMVVLTIPPLATSPTVSVASPSPTAAPTAAPVAATAPAVTAAPAPVPTQPPPPAATTAPSA